jgi:pantothenate kinase
MLDSLLAEVRRLRATVPHRLIVGIAGAPGAGKSTLTAQLVAAVPDAVAVPMDGFHLANVQLRRLGRTRRKGAPDTFDAAGYLALLRRLRADTCETVYAPAFDHLLDEPVAGSIDVPPQARVIITEGNYLLLGEPPWDEVSPLLDLSVFLAADDGQRVAGLVDRQRAKGLDEQAALDWVLTSDEANARLVSNTRARADLRLTR